MGKEIETFSVPNEVIHFPWNVSTLTWPYGMSLYVGLETEFQALAQMELDLQQYGHKTAFPKEVWSVGNDTFQAQDTDVASINTKVKTWEPGDSFVTNLPVALTQGGVGDRKIEGLDTTLNFYKDQIIDGLMIPPISKQYNATQASAKEMMPWAQANLIIPMQRIVKRTIEQEVYAPYLMNMGFSIRTVPRMLFEPPDAHKEEDATYYSQLVTAGIMPPLVAARELGFEEEFIKWDKEQQLRKQEEMQFQKQFGQPQGPPGQQNVKEWFVREVG